MNWEKKRWYTVEIHYIDPFDRCGVVTRHFDNKEERITMIESFIHKESNSFIKEITEILKYDIEKWERK